jgi:hypothetical protein
MRIVEHNRQRLILKYNMMTIMLVLAVICIAGGIAALFLPASVVSGSISKPSSRWITVILLVGLGVMCLFMARSTTCAFDRHAGKMLLIRTNLLGSSVKEYPFEQIIGPRTVQGMRLRRSNFPFDNQDNHTYHIEIEFLEERPVRLTPWFQYMDKEQATALSSTIKKFLLA